MDQQLINISPVLAAILGAFATYIFQKILNWQSERKKKKKLREAFRAELIQIGKYRESIEKAVEKDNLSLEELYILANTEHPFFDSNADKLVQLSSIEQVRLVRFYDILHDFKGMSELMLDGVLEDEHTIEGMEDVDFFLDEFESARQDALEEIEKNL